jgi:methyltransferase (TIGR00027 family)
VPDYAPSATARRVAAYRLGFERLTVSYGDPAADEALARDVAGSAPVGASEAMTRYLRGRTSFFDRVVVNAIERGVTQLVSIGAGYDGRAWRYARPGVRWWEVDRAATQADKRARLARLDLHSDHIGYVAHDLSEAGLAASLVQAGYQPDGPGLFICEGVAVYLGTGALEIVLGEIRSLATVGTRLSLSLATTAISESQFARRRRFQAAVSHQGEPALSFLGADDAGPLLAATRWDSVEISARSRAAGFVMVAPVWAPAPPRAPVTASRTGRFAERMLYRAGVDTLGDHLTATYGVAVTTTKELDLGVFLVERADDSRWVARVFPSSRTPEAAHREAVLLGWLAEAGFPAERCAHSRPVSRHHGQPVLVTEFVAGTRAPATPEAYRALGRLLGRLHSLAPPATERRADIDRHPAGAWHHLILDAGIAREKVAATELFGAARFRVRPGEWPAYDALAADLGGLPDLAGLPHALSHPDPVPVNCLNFTKEPTLVDWTGAGWAPRVAALGSLLWAASMKGPACVEAGVSGYRSFVQPEPAELNHLEVAMWRLPLVLACWTFATGRADLSDQTARWKTSKARIRRAARQARLSFGT